MKNEKNPRQPENIIGKSIIDSKEKRGIVSGKIQEVPQNPWEKYQKLSEIEKRRVKRQLLIG
jgi:hypothetical protein